MKPRDVRGPHWEKYNGHEPPKSLRPRSPSLADKIAEHATHTRDTSNAENHPNIVAWHQRVLKDLEDWKKRNGK